MIDEKHDGYQRRAIENERASRSGIDEQDDEQFGCLGICPDESNTEHGSPLNFGNDAHRSASSYFANNLRRWDREERAVKRRYTTLADELGIRR